MRFLLCLSTQDGAARPMTAVRAAGYSSSTARGKPIETDSALPLASHYVSMSQYVSSFLSLSVSISDCGVFEHPQVQPLIH